MDGRTGEIHRFETEAALKKLEALLHRPLIPLSGELAEKLEPLSRGKRKNTMRNHLCVCGSGKKFKRCCWSKYDQ